MFIYHVHFFLDFANSFYARILEYAIPQYLFIHDTECHIICELWWQGLVASLSLYTYMYIYVISQCTYMYIYKHIWGRLPKTSRLLAKEPHKKGAFFSKQTQQFWEPPRGCHARSSTMGCLRSVGSIKLYVSFQEYRLFYGALLQNRRTMLSILLTKATSYDAFLPLQRGGGLGSSFIFKKFNEPYAPS